MDQTETWPIEKLRRLRRRRLRALVRYAYANLPFYRRRYDEAGIAPESVKGPVDFARLPMVTKADIRRAREDSGSFLTGMESFPNGDLATIGMTSGTTGTDFLYCNRKWRQFQGGRLLRAYWWAGLRPGMRMMLTVPAWHCWAAEESYLAERFGVVGVVPWGTFLPRFAGNFVDAIRDLRPEFLSMFLPMLYAVQAECRRRGLALHEVFAGVRCVLVVGAPLTPASRQKLEADLGVDVYTGAGATEGLIAMECSEHRGYHLFVDTCYLEVVDPPTGALLPPGERGRLVLTAFNPHGAVYIRFDTGDLGRVVKAPCACGRTWPLIEVYDRLDNMFAAEGREFVPYDVRLCVDEIPELTGVPFSVIRSVPRVRADRASPTSPLWLAIQRPLSGNLRSLEDSLAAEIGRKLRVKAAIQWVEELPARWKGAPVIDEMEWKEIARG